MQGLIGPIVGSLLGAGANIIGSKIASDKQLKGVDKSLALQSLMFATGRKDLAPFREVGSKWMDRLGKKLGGDFFSKPISSMKGGYFTKPIKFSQEELEATPGYQFALSQGLKSVQNSYAAKGLGSSGAAMKGAARFATGLADQTWQTRFQEEMNQRNAIFDRLLRSRQDIWGRMYDTAGLGLSAATSGAAQGGDFARSAGSTILGGANASAGATMYGYNQAGGMLGDVGGYAYLNQLFNKE